MMMILQFTVQLTNRAYRYNGRSMRISICRFSL